MLQFPFIPDPVQFQNLFTQIEILSQALKHIPLDTSAKMGIFHREVLKSSLFSARIEGNQLTLAATENTDFTNPETKEKKEISNVLKALYKLPTLPSLLTPDALLELHVLIMKGLNPSAGKFRTESSAIFDQFGTIVYLTPEPEEMRAMLDVLLEEVNRQSRLEWQSQLLMTAACHYYFEKIHPFIDGNGRTGRVLLHYQLRTVPIISEMILPLDQYFDDHRSQYYDFLEKNTRHLTGFYDFFLKGIVWALETYLNDIKHSPVSAHNVEKPTSSLLPRRQEILEIIKDHPLISLDSIRRRFPTIPSRTIAFDVNYLVKMGLIQKHGQTRGVVYSSVN